TEALAAVALSPSGKLLATAGWDRAVRVWDATDATLFAEFTGLPGPVDGVAWSPDGASIAAASGSSIVLCEAKPAGKRTSITAGPGKFRGVAWGGPGLVAGGTDT